MSTHRSTRANSPLRPYDQPRSSTGTFYVTAFDTTTSTQPGRNSVSSVSSVPSRQDISYEAQPIRKSTYRDGKTSKTEYAVRPRHNSSIAVDGRRPLTVMTSNPSPPPRDSIVASPREPSSATVVRENPTRYLTPMSAISPRYPNHHRRHNSITPGELDGYDGRDRREKHYHSRGSSGQNFPKQYHSSRSLPPRNQDEEGWSYTGPREQFDRDYPQRTSPRRDSTSRRERPISVHDQDRSLVRRDPGPPPSASRQLERIDKHDSGRHNPRSGFDSDPDRPKDLPHRRQSLRTPVLHQQRHRDDGYSSAREEHESRGPSRSRPDLYDEDPRREHYQRTSTRDADRDRSHRKEYEREPDRDRPRESERERPRDYERERPLPDNRRKPRSRDPSPERSGLKTLIAGALGSAATAGTLGILQRDSKDKDPESDDDDNKESRRRRHRRRKPTDDRSDESDDPDVRHRDGGRRSRHHEESSSETPEDQSSRHRHSRTRRRDKGEEGDSDHKTDADRNIPQRSSSRARFRDGSTSDTEHKTREIVPAHNQDQLSEYLEHRTMSPGENEDDRPRRVQLVEPVKEKEEAKPRGILKPARQVPFPEDPNPIREGVAPLKDATKDGVPPNARWTKINRVLVNPEALEKYHERFEEREDYVIVLRVLTREEIQKLAQKTQEIRDTREREWKRKPGEQKESQRNENDEYSDRDDGDDRPQLAIEAPAAPPIDLRNLSQQQQQQQYQPQPQQQQQYQPQPQQQQTYPQPLPMRSMPGILPGSERIFDGNYSQQV